MFLQIRHELMQDIASRQGTVSIGRCVGAQLPQSKRLHKLFKGRVGTTANQSFIGSDE